MPHVVIEYCADLPDQPDFKQLFAELHPRLVETVSANLNDIKSRAIPVQHWVVGDGDPVHAFVHARLYLLRGRDADTKRRGLAAMRDVIVAHFPKTQQTRKCQFCFEAIEMDRETYLKVVSNPG